ncbi:MAG: NAD(P)-dependent alcohol dehydrogenase [Solirubrobacterales bacterium]
MIGRGALAAVVDAPDSGFDLRPALIGEPREDELLVRIEAVGICHTDVSVAEGKFGTPFPIVVGHEGTGRVEAVGGAVRDVEVGDRVALSFDFCGRCRNCRDGRPAYCYENWPRNFGGCRLDGTTSLELDGAAVHSHFLGQSSFAEYSVCPRNCATRIESDIPATLLAPLGCGVQTGAGAVLNVLRPEARDAIAIFGLGAVGLSAVMGAAIRGCETIVAVDPNPERRVLAAELGATLTVDPGAEDPVAAVRALHPDGIQFALEMSGVPAVLQQAISTLAPGGTCGLVGAPPVGTRFPLDVHEILSFGRRLQGIVLGDAVPQRFLPELVSYWEDGRLPIEKLVETFPFVRIDEAIGSARSGRVVKPVLELA